MAKRKQEIDEAADILIGKWHDKYLKRVNKPGYFEKEMRDKEKEFKSMNLLRTELQSVF